MAPLATRPANRSPTGRDQRSAAPCGARAQTAWATRSAGCWFDEVGHAEGCPDRLGGSICRLLEVRDLAVTVQALDAIDGMPVLDLKPYMREFGARRPGRAGDPVHGAHSRILEHLRRELRARPGTYRVSRWATTGGGSRAGSVAQPSVGVVLTADGRDIDRGRGHDAARDWH